MKFIGLLTVLMFPLCLCAQTRTENGIKIANLQEQQTSSSLDLLKKANKDKSITIGRTSSKKSASAPKTTAASTTTAQTAAAVAAPSPAVAPAPQTVTQTQSNVLDIPLDIGTTQNVQAVVQQPAKKTAKKQNSKNTAVKLAETKTEPADSQKNTADTEILQGEGKPLDTAAESEEEAAADAELEYAVRMLEQSKKEAESKRSIPPSAAKNKTATVPSRTKKFNPNAFRPNVDWVFSKSNHFDIYTQKSTGGQIGSANMSMLFETAYQTLRRYIPWMMSDRVRVFVYQDHNSYLKHEPNAKAWTRALAYPTRGEIVVYDEPGKQQELKEVFSHELTHIFTQHFFDMHHTGRIMTPTWLDEGLAVLIEDQAYSGSQGGPWTHDYKTLNIQPDPADQPADFTNHSLFSTGFSGRNNGMNRRNGMGRRGRPVYLESFGKFMEEGSLDSAEGKNQTQKWYLQAYLMVRFLLNPAGGTSPSNRMQFEQFTRLLAQGEPMRDPSTGFLVKDKQGNTVYKPYDVEKALARAYNYNSISDFEAKFWQWLKK